MAALQAVAIVQSGWLAILWRSAGFYYTRIPAGIRPPDFPVRLRDLAQLSASLPCPTPA